MLDKNDETKIEKIMVKVVGNALEQIVLPRFQTLEDDFGKHKDENQEQYTEIIDLLNRIETLAKSEIKYVDDLSGRVLKLEIKKA